MFGSFGASWRDHRLALVVFGSSVKLRFVCFILCFVGFPSWLIKCCILQHFLTNAEDAK